MTIVMKDDCFLLASLPQGNEESFSIPLLLCPREGDIEHEDANIHIVIEVPLLMISLVFAGLVINVGCVSRCLSRDVL